MSAAADSVADLFQRLVQIPSPSGRERRLALFIKHWLADRGVAATLDRAGERNDSDAGNLIAVVDGAPGLPCLLFVAHMDTVESGEEAIRPELSAEGVITSRGNTVLGADNKSAVAALMRVCARAAATSPARRPTIVAAFTCREESGRMGASLLDLGDHDVDCGFCIDGNTTIGTTVIRTLGQRTFTFTVTGRTAHAAASPDEGINAIRVVSDVIAALPLGRQHHGGSLNVSSIVGGEIVHRLNADPVLGDGPELDRVRRFISKTATNSVPDVAHVRGEARGFTDAAIQETLDSVGNAIRSVCEAHGAQHDWTAPSSPGIPPFPGTADSRARALVERAAERVQGAEFREIAGPYTLEVNYLATLCDVVAIASGGRNPHQTSESIRVDELATLEEFLWTIVSSACEGLLAPEA